ncbi:MAG TPA: hypothetical protein VGQ33_01870 [Vicinamibacteria bacterium]|nr:hypothetical protein [Vicinamibacteria bacterium]
MPSTVAWILTAVVVWTAVGLALNWGRLSGERRRGVALLVSAAGIVLLMIALSAHGQRETLTTGQFLMGGGPYVTGHVSASASLRYYVATAVCLLLGTAGLAVPDLTAGRLRRHWVGNAIGLSLVITALRFALEKVAAPMSWTHPIGITWLAPVVGAMFLLHAREEGKGLRALAWALLVYALASRAAVALLMVVASALQMGSHYDLSAVTNVWFWGHAHTFEAGSLTQVLYLGVLPQLTFWVAYTVATGMIGAGFAAALLWARGRRPMGYAAADTAAPGTRGLES